MRGEERDGKTENFGFRAGLGGGTRSLLVYCAAKTLPFREADITSQGWNLTRVGAWASARAHMDSLGAGVGIVCLQDANEKEVAEVEALLGYGNSRFRWIAILDLAFLKSAVANHLISECCLDFHVAPVDVPRLLHSLGHALGMANLSRVRPQQSVENRFEKNIIGTSQAMKATFRRIAKISQSDAPVLIQGETGTGKELCALAIHAHSSRASRPFVAVNCGALPDKLIQSELFGHEKGAFTGAHQRKIGRIEAAEGGTLFLDEIGDLSLDLQVNLLRVLQGGTYERVGGTETMHADIRVIAATHVNIEKAVGEKRFREDLYYRLNVLNLDVPPLRAREGDVTALARHWFDTFAAEKNPQVRGFSRDAFIALSQHTWPGNVRELINRVRRAMVMCERQLIGPEDLGLDYVGSYRDVPVEETLAEARERAEREAICEAIEKSGGNLSRSARSLGVSRVTLYRLLDKYQIAHRVPRA